MRIIGVLTKDELNVYFVLRITFRGADVSYLLAINRNLLQAENIHGSSHCLDPFSI